MRAERYRRLAGTVSQQALACEALVPLQTTVVQEQALKPFLLRELRAFPRPAVRTAGPRVNPFLPWDRPLEVDRLSTGHVLLLNKYPVQDSHLLVITSDWQPQNGWLRPEDWQAVAEVAADTGGLWFFNSSATAGASQPHRHLQLLPRQDGMDSCPLALLLLAQLQGQAPPWSWAYRLSRRWDPIGGSDLPELYRRHALDLELGSATDEPCPRHAYNLVFDDAWFLTVRRRQEHQAGFSINGLGFAGYLLCTPSSDQEWLLRHGPWALLEAVACEGSVFSRLRRVD